MCACLELFSFNAGEESVGQGETQHKETVNGRPRTMGSCSLPQVTVKIVVPIHSQFERGLVSSP